MAPDGSLKVFNFEMDILITKLKIIILHWNEVQFFKLSK